jgi:hypothetical protein
VDGKILTRKRGVCGTLPDPEVRIEEEGYEAGVF